MIRLTIQNTERAIAKCMQLKLRVKIIKDRLFAVHSGNNANVYQIVFDV